MPAMPTHLPAMPAMPTLQAGTMIAPTAELTPPQLAACAELQLQHEAGEAGGEAGGEGGSLGRAPLLTFASGTIEAP